MLQDVETEDGVDRTAKRVRRQLQHVVSADVDVGEIPDPTLENRCQLAFGLDRRDGQPTFAKRNGEGTDAGSDLEHAWAQRRGSLEQPVVVAAPVALETPEDALLFVHATCKVRTSPALRASSERG